MKYLVILAFVGVVVAQNRPQRPFDNRPFDNRPPSPPDNRPLPRIQPNSNQKSSEVTIVKQYFEDTGNGGSTWGYQNSDGSERHEKTYFKDAGALGMVLVQEGFYTNYDNDGKLIKVKYLADENGFQILEDNRI